MGVIDFKGLSVAYYSAEARIFVHAPNTAKTLVRMKEDIGATGSQGSSDSTLILKISKSRSSLNSPSTCRETPVMDTVTS